MAQFMYKNLLATVFCLSTLSAFSNDMAAEQKMSSSDALKTISFLDVARYMGTWYEIAKYPNWFQRKCVGGTRAEYSLLSDGQVKVTNRCNIASGEVSEAIGVARQVGPSTSPKLEVRFAPAWLSFLRLAWGDYWVIDLDDGYQLAAVSEPRKKHLWILSRTPKVDSVSYNSLLTRLQQKGFDLQRLEVTPQD